MSLARETNTRLKAQSGITHLSRRSILSDIVPNRSGTDLKRSKSFGPKTVRIIKKRCQEEGIPVRYANASVLLVYLRMEEDGIYTTARWVDWIEIHGMEDSCQFGQPSLFTRQDASGG